MTPIHADLRLDHASAARLEVLFLDWPPVARAGAHSWLRAVLGTDEDCVVRLVRRGQCVLLRREDTGHRVRLRVPPGC